MEEQRTDNSEAGTPGTAYDSEWMPVSSAGVEKKEDEWTEKPKKRNVKPALAAIMIIMVLWYFALFVMMRRRILYPTTAMILGIPPIVIPIIMYIVVKSRRGGM